MADQNSADQNSAGQPEEDPDEIPDPLSPPPPQLIPDDTASNGTYIVFDLETTGFGLSFLYI